MTKRVENVGVPATAEPGSDDDLSCRPRWLPLILLLFVSSATTLIIGMVLEFDVLTKAEIIRGPFPMESGTRAAIVPIGQAYQSISCCVRPRGDDNAHSTVSSLRAWLNGRELGPPHSQHQDIRTGKTTGFSHWGDTIRFYVPASIPNDQWATLRVEYPIKYSTAMLRLNAAVVIVLLFIASIGAFGLAMVAATVVRLPYLGLRTANYLALTSSFIYIGCSAGALLSGWALPTTALIRWSFIASWLARNESLLGFYLLILAGFGALSTWSAILWPQARLTIEQEELALLPILRRWGIVIVTCASVFSLSTMWAGVIRYEDLSQGSSIGGLIPFSDASGYVLGAHDEAKTGIWNTWTLRRPLAEAFRTTLLFLSGYSYPSMLLLQSCLLSIVTCFAVWAVVRWRGLWAGVAFLGFSQIYIPFFVPTALTEPLGLFWILFVIPFLIDSLRTQSLSSALITLGAITTALMTRMGAMFTIPALAIWIVWQFGKGWKARLTVLIAVVLVTGSVVLANFTLTKIYGPGQDVTGSNFSSVLCGLTLGTTWDGCLKTVEQEGKHLPSGEAATASYLYSMASQNFKKQPSVLVRRMISAAQAFLSELPDVLFRGFAARAVTVPSNVGRIAISLISIFGLIFVFLRLRENGELTFWILLWLGIIASAPIVYFDDGTRVLSTSYVFVWLFFALGFARPTARAAAEIKEAHSQKLITYGVLTFAGMAFLFFNIPWVAYKLSPARQLVGRVTPPKKNEMIVFGGRRMSGFLVVGDGSPLRSDFPTLELSTFSAIIKQSHVEEVYQGVLNPHTPPVPFGFISAPTFDPTPSYAAYIVPPEVVERQDVLAWRFEIADWNRYTPYGPYWFLVTHAEPVQ